MLVHHSQVAMGLLLIILAMATYSDIKNYRIPNAITFGGLAFGLVLQTSVLGISGLISGLGGFITGLCLFLPFYLLGGMAAGDVKLMAALGAFLGTIGALFAVGLSLIAGSLIGLSILIVRGGVFAWLRRYGYSVKYLFTTGKLTYLPPQPHEASALGFPYAVAIAVGTLLTLIGVWPLGVIKI